MVTRNPATRQPERLWDRGLRAEKSHVPKAGGGGSIVPVPGRVASVRLTQCVIRGRGSGHGCRRYR